MLGKLFKLIYKCLMPHSTHKTLGSLIAIITIYFKKSV